MPIRVVSYGDEFSLDVMDAGVFADGTRALVLNDHADGERYTRLTVSVPGVLLEEGEHIVKTYAENQFIREPLLASGLFTDTGRRITQGFIELEVWLLTPDMIIPPEV